MLLIAIIVILFIAFFAGYLLSPAQGEATMRSEEAVTKYEEHILALDRDALDQAYREHIKLVFGIWMKGPSDPESPRRAGLGARNAREGYIRSMEAIERRERRVREQK